MLLVFSYSGGAGEMLLSLSFFSFKGGFSKTSAAAISVNGLSKTSGESKNSITGS